MNLNDIMKQVNRDIDDQYIIDDIRDWVNRCLDELTPFAKKESMATTDANNTNVYELPSDLFEIAFIKVNGQILNRIAINDNNNQGYKVWEKTMFLQPSVDSGQIELYYYRTLTHVEVGEDVPDLEPEFHDLLIFFCLGNMQFYDEDYDLRPDSFLRYENRKKDYIQYKLKKNRKKMVTEKVIW